MTPYQMLAWSGIICILVILFNVNKIRDIHSNLWYFIMIWVMPVLFTIEMITATMAIKYA